MINSDDLVPDWKQRHLQNQETTTTTTLTTSTKANNGKDDDDDDDDNDDNEDYDYTTSTSVRLTWTSPSNRIMMMKKKKKNKKKRRKTINHQNTTHNSLFCSLRLEFGIGLAVSSTRLVLCYCFVCYVVLCCAVPCDCDDLPLPSCVPVFVRYLVVCLVYVEFLKVHTVLVWSCVWPLFFVLLFSSIRFRRSFVRLVRFFCFFFTDTLAFKIVPSSKRFLTWLIDEQVTYGWWDDTTTARTPTKFPKLNIVQCTHEYTIIRRRTRGDKN